MIWRNPVAWFGLAFLAVPIVVHLLTRRRPTPVLFPSLRFLLPGPAASVRLRGLSDTGLLAVRLAAVAAAVAALADPVAMTPWRQSAWNARVSRAVVVDDAAAWDGRPSDEARSAQVSSLLAGTFASTVVAGPLPVAVGDALSFLEGVPPSRREIVVISSLLEGRFEPGALGSVPAYVGLRFEPTTIVEEEAGRLVFAPGGEGTGQWAVSVSRDGPTIEAAYEPGGVVTPDALVTVAASAADRPDVEAARRAALAAGGRFAASMPFHWMVVSDEPDAPVLDEVGPASSESAGVFARLAADGETVATGLACQAETLRPWPPSLPDGLWPIVSTADAGVMVLGGERDGRPAFISRVDPGSLCGARLLAGAIAATAGPETAPRGALERWPAERVTGMTRDAALPGADDLARADDRDARWFWLLAALLLVAEGWYRRRLDAASEASSPEVSAVNEVGRVA